ncbi:tetratricopeptide repeat protein [Paludisphaera rhizosphaerae]|uniref:tetratricopeptide repeat protein n=1 Tax=Paludisphaera rhizosphaerae TaxID=2711216 RepID=UPI0013EAADAC|nr:hypothetical protein [Paludisphaera rhizosphaerae]
MTSPDDGIKTGLANEAGTGRKRGNGAATVVLLAVIAVAGIVIYRNIPDRPWFPATPTPETASAAPPPKPIPVSPNAPDPADVTSLISISKARDGRATVELARPVAPRDVSKIAGTDQDLLFREFARQAVLIAARDERGAATRDELLDDAPPTAEAVAQVGTLFRTNVQSRLLIRPVAAGKVDEQTEPLTVGDLDPKKVSGEAEPELVLTEKLSRTSIPETLDRLGLKGEPNAYRADASVPNGVEEKLGSLGLVDLVRAIREVHAAIRTDGESPARLGALVRGYATLGALTTHHWSAAHRAFEARSLLYAQRLVAKEESSAFALRHRAFAEALAGRHASAIKDLTAAAGREGGAEAPAWVEVIDAYVQYALPRLGAAKPPHDRLGAYLKMLAVEQPAGTRQLIHAAEAVIQVDPDCSQAFDMISSNGGLSDLHKATVLGPQSFHEFLRSKLHAAKDLPESARKSLEDEDDAALDDALAQAGRVGSDSGEPSWGVLAHLARETRFVQVMRRLDFMRKKWSVPVDDFWEAARTSIMHHPYRPFLGMLAGNPEDRRDYEEFSMVYDRADLESTEAPFILHIQHTPGPALDSARDDWNLVGAHNTSSVRDITLMLNGTREELRANYAERLMEASPNNAYAASMLVKYDWAKSQPKLAEWKERHGNSAAFLFALANKLIELDRHDEARPVLTHYIIVSPDRWGYDQLAECQQKAGDEAGWLETLNAYLEDTENSGLDHATVQVRLARFYLKKGLPEKARPYAYDAAATWAGWAMKCAAEVDEQLGDLESAGAWLQRTAERYPSSWADWYLFSRRTGRAEPERAAKLARVMTRVPGATDPVTLAFYHWIEGDADAALRTLNPGTASTNDLRVAINLALLQDQTGATDERDKTVKRMVDEMKNSGPKTVEICEMLFGSLAPGAKPPDLAAIDAMIADWTPEPRSIVEYLVGRFLLNRGRIEDARKHLEYCVGYVGFNSWYRTATSVWLREASPDAKPTPKPANPGRKPDDPTTT